jgi:hypothetical protein
VSEPDEVAVAAADRWVLGRRPDAERLRRIAGLAGQEPPARRVIRLDDARYLLHALAAETARAEAAEALTRRALSLRFHGEHAPGGGDDWPAWCRDAETWARSGAPQQQRQEGRSQ